MRRIGGCGVSAPSAESADMRTALRVLRKDLRSVQIMAAMAMALVALLVAQAFL